MAKKKYLVVPRTTSAMRDGLKTSKGTLNFGKKTGKIVDASMASEIEHEHGLKGSGDVWVHEDENYSWHLRHDGMTDGRSYGIHHYTFAGVDLKGRGGNERVKVKTADGYTFMSREQAEELELEIIEKGKQSEKSNHRDA